MSRNLIYLIGITIFALITNTLYYLNSGDLSFKGHIPPTIVGSLIGFLATNTYLLFQTTKALKKEQQKVHEAMQLKSAFLANMSHEIRTPLHAILGFTTTLEQSELNSKQKEALQAISNATKSLKTIVDDILDFSKIESGKLEIQIEPFSLLDTCNELISTFKPMAWQKSLSLHLEYDHTLNSISLDEVRIRQILINLIGNAIKFTQEGSVTLSIKSTKLDQEHASVSFKVIDTGIGIKDEDKASILEPFTQAKDQKVKDFGGTGLGLSISNQLAKLMNGSLTIEDNHPHGAIFRLHFDRVVINEALPKHHAQNLTLPNLKGKTLLIVDDIATNRILLKMLLEESEATLIEATNGQEALERFKDQRVDLIFMDIKMPVLNGIDATKALKADYEKLPPIIALSADVLHSNPDEIGIFDDFLAKPIEQHKFLELLQKYLA